MKLPHHRMGQFSVDFERYPRSGRALARRFDFSQASLCNAFPSILEVFSRHGNSHGPGAGTHTSAGPPSLGRVSGNLHEAVTSAAIATLAGFRSRRSPLPLRSPPRLVPTKTPRRKIVMKTRAAVALEKAKPLTVTE